MATGGGTGDKKRWGRRRGPEGKKTFFWKGGENLNIQEIKLNTRIKEEIEVEEKQSIS